MADPSRRLHGALLILAATVCWSSGGILVRLTEGVDGFTVVFWRAVFMALTIGAYLAIRHGRGAVATVRAMGGAGVLSGLLLSGCFIFYILSLQRTAVANTVVLMSVSPLIAAVLARFALGERLGWRTLAAILAALGGIAVMVAGGLGQGSLSGNLFALAVGLCFGANIVVVRARPEVDMVPASLIGGLFAALFTLPAAAPLAVPLSDLGILAVMGVGQLGAGLFLFLTGARYLSSAETGLLGLMEVVLSPVWVLGIGELPPVNALAGGAIVLGAVAAHAVLSAREERAQPVPPVGLSVQGERCSL